MLRICACLTSRTNEWVELWQGEAYSADVLEYLVFTPEGLCASLFPTNRIQIEFDTCNTFGWNEVDAVELIGTITNSDNVRYSDNSPWCHSGPGALHSIGEL